MGVHPATAGLKNPEIVLGRSDGVGGGGVLAGGWLVQQGVGGSTLEWGNELNLIHSMAAIPWWPQPFSSRRRESAGRITKSWLKMVPAV
jgi:hypothetical protein